MVTTPPTLLPPLYLTILDISLHSSLTVTRRLGEVKSLELFSPLASMWVYRDGHGVFSPVPGGRGSLFRLSHLVLCGDVLSSSDVRRRFVFVGVSWDKVPSLLSSFKVFRH